MTTKTKVQTQTRTLAQHLCVIGACGSAREWSEPFTSALECWNACERPDWLLWWAARTPENSKSDIVQCAIAFAEDVLHLCSNRARPRVEAAIQAAKDWVAEPTEENRKKARAAADAAYAAADDAAAAYADAAADAAADDAAAYAADAAADDAAVRQTKRLEYCALIRSILRQPWTEAN